MSYYNYDNYYNNTIDVINNWDYVHDYIDYSPYSLQPVYRFPPSFIVDEEDLNLVASGIAIHNNKDVTFDLNLFDQNQKPLTSFQDVSENPFVQGVNISILDKFGNTVSYHYIKNSFQKTFTLTEQDNIKVFGFYEPDFGIQLEVLDLNLNRHVSRFQVYANQLEIESIYVTDSNGYWLNEDPIGFQSYIPYRYNYEGFDVQAVTNNAYYINKYNTLLDAYDININAQITFAKSENENIFVDWGDGNSELILQRFGDSVFNGNVIHAFTDTEDEYLIPYYESIDGYLYEFSLYHNYLNTGRYNVNFYYSGNGSTGLESIKSIDFSMPYELKENGLPQFGNGITGGINFDINFLNDPNYVNFDYFDIYGSTSSNVLLNEENFIKKIDIPNSYKSYDFVLDGSNFISNLDYWFIIIPYSKIKAGYPWKIGPYRKYEAPIPESITSANKLNISNGAAIVQTQIITGIITGFEPMIIDQSIKNGSYFAHEYLTRFDDQLNHHMSSKLLVVDNSSGQDTTRTGLSFTEYSISDNYFVSFNVYDDAENIYLTARHDYSNFESFPTDPNSFYKIQKVSI